MSLRDLKINNMSIIYFDVVHAIKEHDHIIDISGGLTGMNDVGLLESVIVHVQNDLYYPNFSNKLTHIVFSIAMNHAFRDGNKRSSIALGAFFLELNGYENLVGTFIVEMENIVLWVAKKYISKDFLHEIIDSLLTHGYLHEDIQFKLATTLHAFES